MTPMAAPSPKPWSAYNNVNAVNSNGHSTPFGARASSSSYPGGGGYGGHHPQHATPFASPIPMQRGMGGHPPRHPSGSSPVDAILLSPAVKRAHTANQETPDIHTRYQQQQQFGVGIGGGNAADFMSPPPPQYRSNSGGGGGGSSSNTAGRHYPAQAMATPDNNDRGTAAVGRPYSQKASQSIPQTAAAEEFSFVDMSLTFGGDDAPSQSQRPADAVPPAVAGGGFGAAAAVAGGGTNVNSGRPQSAAIPTTAATSLTRGSSGGTATSPPPNAPMHARGPPIPMAMMGRGGATFGYAPQAQQQRIPYPSAAPQQPAYAPTVDIMRAHAAAAAAFAANSFSLPPSGVGPWATNNGTTHAVAGGTDLGPFAFGGANGNLQQQWLDGIVDAVSARVIAELSQSPSPMAASAAREERIDGDKIRDQQEGVGKKAKGTARRATSPLDGLLRKLLDHRDREQRDWRRRHNTGRRRNRGKGGNSNDCSDSEGDDSTADSSSSYSSSGSGTSSSEEERNDRRYRRNGGRSQRQGHSAGTKKKRQKKTDLAGAAGVFASHLKRAAAVEPYERPTAATRYMDTIQRQERRRALARTQQALGGGGGGGGSARRGMLTAAASAFDPTYAGDDVTDPLRPSPAITGIAALLCGANNSNGMEEEDFLSEYGGGGFAYYAPDVFNLRAVARTVALRSARSAADPPPTLRQEHLFAPAATSSTSAHATKPFSSPISKYTHTAAPAASILKPPAPSSSSGPYPTDTETGTRLSPSPAPSSSVAAAAASERSVFGGDDDPFLYGAMAAYPTPSRHRSGRLGYGLPYGAAGIASVPVLQGLRGSTPADILYGL